MWIYLLVFLLFGYPDIKHSKILGDKITQASVFCLDVGSVIVGYISLYLVRMFLRGTKVKDNANHT